MTQKDLLKHSRLSNIKKVVDFYFYQTKACLEMYCVKF